MSRKNGAPENHRIVVSPRSLTNFGFVSISRGMFYSGPDGDARYAREMQSRCEEIAADIRRQVDNVGFVEIASDTEFVCEHCGSRWTEDGSEYNGGCCAADEEAEEARLAAKGTP